MSPSGRGTQSAQGQTAPRSCFPLYAEVIDSISTECAGNPSIVRALTTPTLQNSRPVAGKDGPATPAPGGPAAPASRAT